MTKSFTNIFEFDKSYKVIKLYSYNIFYYYLKCIKDQHLCLELVKKSRDRYYQKYFTLLIPHPLSTAHVCKSFRMKLLFLCLLSVLICHISSHQLFELCVNSECVWQGEGMYGGCLPDHVTTLRFPYFDTSIGVLDLRCTAVQIIFIENSPMSCGESFILGGTKGAVLYMNVIQCVSKILNFLSFSNVDTNIFSFIQLLQLDTF